MSPTGEAERLRRKALAQGVAFQRAVPHGAEHRSVARAAEELLGGVTAGDPAVVNLVPRRGHTESFAAR